MKVPTSTGATEAPTTFGTNAPGKKTGAFDRLLHAKESNTDKGQNSQVAPPTDPQALSPNLANDDVIDILQATPEVGKASPIASSTTSVASTQIQNLAREIVSEIRSVANKDGSRTVDIQFDSKTLQGLQVHITERQGNLSIQFATQSENVAALLADHKNDLANALAADGFTVKNISTSVQPKRSGYTVTRDRNSKQR